MFTNSGFAQVGVWWNRQRLSMLCCLTALMIGTAAHAEDLTPMDAPLAEEQVTTITCECKVSEPVFIGDATVKAQPGIYHYNVFVPKGYNDPANAKLTYPCLFVCNGSGNPKINDFKDFASSNRWIVVLVTDAKNGPWNPIFGDWLASHDDAMKRLRIRDGLKFAIGGSGGAAMTGYGITARRGFVAWIPFIGSAPGSKASRMNGLIVHGVFGRKDNRVGVKYAQEFVTEFDRPNLRFSWTTHGGGHEWGCKQVVGPALAVVRDQLLQTARLSPEETGLMLSGLAEEFEAGDTMIGRKYEIAKQVTEVARRAGLSRRSEWAAKLEAMNNFMRDCRTDKKQRDEVDAYSAWQTVLANQKKVDDHEYIGKASATEAPTLREKCEKELKDIAEKYPDTQAAAKIAKP